MRRQAGVVRQQAGKAIPGHWKFGVKAGWLDALSSALQAHQLLQPHELLMPLGRIASCSQPMALKSEVSVFCAAVCCCVLPPPTGQLGSCDPPECHLGQVRPHAKLLGQQVRAQLFHHYLVLTQDPQHGPAHQAAVHIQGRRRGRGTSVRGGH